MVAYALGLIGLIGLVVFLDDSIPVWILGVKPCGHGRCVSRLPFCSAPTRCIIWSLCIQSRAYPNMALPQINGHDLPVKDMR